MFFGASATPSTLSPGRTPWTQQTPSHPEASPMGPCTYMPLPFIQRVQVLTNSSYIIRITASGMTPGPSFSPSGASDASGLSPGWSPAHIGSPGSPSNPASPYSYNSPSASPAYSPASPNFQSPGSMSNYSPNSPNYSPTSPYGKPYTQIRWKSFLNETSILTDILYSIQ